MRSIVIGILSILSFTLNAQEMKSVKETVAQMFISTDEHDWDKVENCFTKKVELDYSSMTGNPAVKLTPKQITSSWKGILPGFQYTHHQLSNEIVKVDKNSATLFCYGTATHFLEDEKGNIWTVVGSYNFHLTKENHEWKISRMKFNFKYQDGNTKLPEKAMSRLKK